MPRFAPVVLTGQKNSTLNGALWDEKASPRYYSLSAVQQCTDRQGNLLLLIVDVDDLSLNLLADGQSFLSLCDAMISNLRNVDQAVNARNDLASA